MIPDRRAIRVLEGHLAFGPGGVEEKRDHRVLTDVLGDVLLGIVRAHLLLVDVLLEDVAQHVGVDSRYRCAVGRRFVDRCPDGLGQNPIVSVQKIEDTFEGLVLDLNILAVSVRPFELVHVEQAAVEEGNMAEELFKLGCALPATETLMEQAQKEIAVEGVELVPSVLGAHTIQPIAEIVAVVV